MLAANFNQNETPFLRWYESGMIVDLLGVQYDGVIRNACFSKKIIKSLTKNTPLKNPPPDKPWTQAGETPDTPQTLMVHIETIVGMFYGENINEIKRLNIQSVFVFFLV